MSELAAGMLQLVFSKWNTECHQSECTLQIHFPALKGGLAHSDNNNNKQGTWAREKLFEMKVALSVASPDSSRTGVIVCLISNTQKPADLGHHCRCQWYYWVQHEWRRWAYFSGSQKQPKTENALRSALPGTADARITPVICKSDLVWGEGFVWCARLCMLAMKF